MNGIGRKNSVFFLMSIFLSFFGWAHLAHADVQVTASVDRAQATMEDEINLTVTVEGSQKASDPVLPSMPAFRSVGSGNSSSLQIMNGEVSFKKEYTYILVPKNEGKFTIGPMSVFAGGHEYKTRPLEIEITRSPSTGSKPIPLSPSQSLPPFLDQEPQLSAPETHDESTKPYWMTTSVSNFSPFVNEEILFTFRFYTREKVGTAQLTQPDFKDFWSDEVVPEKKYYQEINGQRYVVSEKVIALYPLRSGELTIGETTLNVEVPDKRLSNPFNDPFFGFGTVKTRPKILRADSIKVNVKPLPENKPDDFTNLVGQFSLTVDLSEPEIKVGETSTLTLLLLGKGNVKDAVLPNPFDLLSFKVYDDKPTVETTRKETGIEGKKVFKKALVPLVAGDYEIKPFSLSFFNPKSGQYESLESPALKLTVLPSGPEAILPQEPQGIAPSPIHQIAEEKTLLKMDFPSKLKEAKKILLWMGLFFLMGLLLYLGFVFYLYLHRKKKSEGHLIKQKQQRALKEFKKGMNQIRLDGSVTQALTPLLHLFRQFVSNRLAWHRRSLTPEEIGLMLLEKGVKKDLKIQSILEELEGVCYGGLQTKRSFAEWKEILMGFAKKI